MKIYELEKVTYGSIIGSMSGVYFALKNIPNTFSPKVMIFVLISMLVLNFLIFRIVNLFEKMNKKAKP